MFAITASNTFGSTNAVLFITINILSCFITSGVILDLCLLQQENIMKEFENKLLNSFLLVLSFAWGVGTMTIYGIAISESIVTWMRGQALTAAAQNTSISSMVTTIGNIPDWSKNGSKEFYTAGGVGIEVLCWGKS